MKRAVAALLIATLGWGLAACSKRATTAPHNPDRLTIAISINPTQLNAILPQNSNENFLDGLLYSELVTIDEKHREVPDLATAVPTQENGGISKDGLTITYHLRPNAKWHDGVAVTSKDVKFTWQAIMNPSNNVVSRHGFDQVTSVDTPDDHTVVFHMKQIFPPAIDTIFGESDTPLRVLPEHVLAKYPNINQIPFNAAPIGSGPYKFVRWLRGDRIILAANPDYYRGAPHIKELDIKIIPDGNTIESQLRSHESDLGLEIVGTNYASLASDSELTRLVADAPSYVSMNFNVTRAPLNDINVRHAIALAIDKDGIVAKNTYGTGKVAITDITPFSWAYDGSMQPIPFKADLAKAILARDGWKPGADGILTKGSQRLSIQLVYGQGSTLARNVAVQVQQMLHEVGIDLQLKSYDYATLYAAAQSGGILNAGKFDVTFYSWISGADPDNSSQWLCSMIPPAGNNVTRYCSSMMDSAQHQALSTFDRKKRKAAYATIAALQLRDIPVVYLYYQGLRYAFNPALKNFTPNGISEGWNAQDWTF